MPDPSTASHPRRDFTWYRTDADVLYPVGLPAMQQVCHDRRQNHGDCRRVAAFEGGGRASVFIMTRLFADNSPDIEMRLRGNAGAPSPTIIDVLREKMEHAFVGVGSLTSPFQMGEGSCSYTTYDRVRKALPQAQFEDAEDMCCGR